MTKTYDTHKGTTEGRAQTLYRRDIRSAKYAPTAFYTFGA